MDEAVEEELKLGELLRNDILRELDVLQRVSSSLLMLDLKRKHIESHFDSLVKMIGRKRDEAIEAISVREERRLEELRLKEVRVEKLRKGVFGEIFVRSRGIDEEMERMERFEERLKVWEEEIERRVADMEVREKEIEKRGVEVEVREKEIEKRVAEFEVKEKEMNEVKMYVDRLCEGLTRKEREINGLKKVVDELKAEGERHDAERRKLADENHVLQGEVKLLIEKLEAKSKVPGREEQLEVIRKFLHVLTSAGIISVCNPVKESEVSGQELFIIVRDSINDQGAAASKVSSVLLKVKDNAPELVVEALRISYLSESEEKNSQLLLASCRILLLEQLGHLCPQRKSQVKNEALKVAGEWSAQIESCGLKPVEVSRFLQFLSMYDIASEFSDEVFVPMLHCVAVHEGTPDFCFTMGFSNRINGYIKTMITNNQRLQALVYVTTFKMVKEFSVVKIIQGHLKWLRNICQTMLEEGVDRKAAEAQVLDLQITTLKELIECIKDLKLQSIYTTGNLEERLVNLEKQKYHNKRPAQCANPSSDLEPPRKKGCNVPETAKSPEPNPSISNIRPEVGSSDLHCSGANSASVPVAENISKFPETFKSAEVNPEASGAYPKVTSGDSLSSNRNGNSEPQRKKECELPGTPNLMEVAPKTPHTNPETESRDEDRSTTNSDAKLTKVASTTPNTHPKTISRKALSAKPNSNSEQLRNMGCILLPPAEPHDISPKGTQNSYPETRARNLLSSNPNSCPQPLRTNECKIPGQTKLMEVARNTSNAMPETGSKDIFRSKPESHLEPARNKVYGLPGTAKLREVALNPNNAYLKTFQRDALCSKPNINPEPWTNKRCNFLEPAKPQEIAPTGILNVHPESGLRNTLHAPEMEKASFRYGATAPTYSSYSNISCRPWGYQYQPPLSTRPPQYHHPYPPLESNPRPQVPSWHHSMPNKPPCFDYRR